MNYNSPSRSTNSDNDCGMPPCKRLFREKDAGPIVLAKSPGASVGWI